MNDDSLNLSGLINNQSLAISEFPDESSFTIESILIEDLQKTQQELTVLATKSIPNEPVFAPVNAQIEKKDDVSFITPSILTQYDATTVGKVQQIANDPASSKKLTNEQKQIIAQFYGI
jgi:hypothetical protein